MQFIYDNGLYKVARITGPSHNLLAIRLSESNGHTNVVSLPIKTHEKNNIDSKDVLNQVMLSLSLVNKELKKDYHISEIQYLPSDTYSSTVYEMLTTELIKRIDSGGEFLKV
jgi:S-adenosylmethionine synthetase